MIKKFNEYINEGLRDQMKPKDKEEIKKNINSKKGIEKLRYINKYNLKKYFTDEEIENLYYELNLIQMIDLVVAEDYYDYNEIKYAIKNFYNEKDKLIHDFGMSTLDDKIIRAYDIIEFAFGWNKTEVFDFIEKRYGIKINNGMIVDALELMKDEDLVDLYSILIDKINDLPND